MLKGYVLGVVTVLVLVPLLGLAGYGAVALLTRGETERQLAGCSKQLTDAVWERARELKDDAANLAACERVPKCENMQIPVGHELCRDKFGVRRQATAAEAAEYEDAIRTDAGWKARAQRVP